MMVITKYYFFANDLEIMIILSYLAKGIFQLSLRFLSGETKEVGTEWGEGYFCLFGSWLK